VPSLTDFLRKEIKKHGLAQVAKKSGISYQVLHRFVLGQRDNLRLDTAERLFQALGLFVARSRRKEEIEQASRTLVSASIFIESAVRIMSEQDELLANLNVSTNEVRERCKSALGKIAKLRTRINHAERLLHRARFVLR
jgi:transcriptional regulator with XRE-family HTH domain